MLMFQIFTGIVRLFIIATVALILFPMWILLIAVTSPVRIFSVSAHVKISDKLTKGVIGLLGAIYNF